jgi:hypothetical protein
MRYLAAGLTVLALTACGTQSGATATPAPTVTVTAAPAVAPESIEAAAVRLVWDGMTLVDRADICRIWIAAPDLAEAAYKDGHDDRDGSWSAFVVLLNEEC